MAKPSPIPALCFSGFTFTTPIVLTALPHLTQSAYPGRPYDGEIAFADAQVGRLVAALSQQGRLEKSLVVLVSDHGESLGEHGEKTHGFFVYNSTLHIACVVKVPAAAPRVISDEVSLVDVMPTVLQALGISSRQPCKGAVC